MEVLRRLDPCIGTDETFALQPQTPALWFCGKSWKVQLDTEVHSDALLKLLRINLVPLGCLLACRRLYLDYWNPYVAYMM